MNDLSATDAFYAARPTLKVGGREEPALGIALLSLSVHEDTGGLFRCEATFGNWGDVGDGLGFLYFDRELLDFGADLQVEMGDREAAATLFEGRITALEGRFPSENPPELLVLAEDRFQDLRMTRRTRSFEEVDLAGIVGQIAGEHGLRNESDLDGPAYPVLAQVNQSDLAFLRDCARGADAEIWVDGDTLHAQARGRRNRGELRLRLGHRLQEFAVSADLARQRSVLAVTGWDVAAKEGIEEEATESSLQGELGSDIGGGGLLTQVFGERRECIAHQLPLSAEQARGMAEAEYRRIARGFVTGRGRAEGDGRLRVGSRVALEGLGPLFEGSYYLTEVTHSYDLHNGYRTFFRVQRPGMGGR